MIDHGVVSISHLHITARSTHILPNLIARVTGVIGLRGVVNRHLGWFVIGCRIYLQESSALWSVVDGDGASGCTHDTRIANGKTTCRGNAKSLIIINSYSVYINWCRDIHICPYSYGMIILWYRTLTPVFRSKPIGRFFRIFSNKNILFTAKMCKSYFTIS